MAHGCAVPHLPLPLTPCMLPPSLSLDLEPVRGPAQPNSRVDDPRAHSVLIVHRQLHADERPLERQFPRALSLGAYCASEHGDGSLNNASHKENEDNKPWKV
eukprot:CAMPEP_0183351748 /NCGR_PEP_ID=MMETSP0164_2-20130417/26230_1 /TAXON_ID=221442 /ORGANISM="Coccolithus pelagicus ssp braarudi, Strain PLY182g" /LENGTH=101 /DNA_ID=CAMNT_0025524013 /DNA_START=494 /DNA_END=800 /DNA_ORIENTATION=+